MDGRRRLASLVLEQGLSVAAAARELGVSRQTAYVWLARAEERGIVGMAELSRRPKRSPGASADWIVQAVLDASGRVPFWGPSKLHALLWPTGEAPVCERTVARILQRAGRSTSRPTSKAEVQRFEKPHCNDMWQIDFKKVGSRRGRCETANVVDDSSRFCIACAHVPDQTLESVWGVLWDAFGAFGLPDSVLSDNGPAFRNNATWRWSSFDLQLMLLGIRPIHGRPYHPQTQGKIERFHGTMSLELDIASDQLLQPNLDAFRDRYNWTRPHQALGQRTPGSIYKPSEIQRPCRMPEPFFPEGAEIRKASDCGLISYKGERYKLGRSFAHQPIGIVLSETGKPAIAWGTFTLSLLEEFQSVKDVLSQSVKDLLSLDRAGADGLRALASLKAVGRKSPPLKAESAYEGSCVSSADPNKLAPAL